MLLFPSAVLFGHDMCACIIKKLPALFHSHLLFFQLLVESRESSVASAQSEGFGAELEVQKLGAITLAGISCVHFYSCNPVSHQCIHNTCHESRSSDAHSANEVSAGLIIVCS